MKTATGIMLSSLVVGASAHGWMKDPAARNHLALNTVINGRLCDWDCENSLLTQNPPGLPNLPWPQYLPGFHPGQGVPNGPCGYWKTDPFSPGNQTLIEDFETWGPVQKAYRAGETVRMSWLITANHGGVYSYRICRDGTDTEECFKNGILNNADGRQWMPTPSVDQEVVDYMVIPSSLPSGRYTVSWRWDCDKTAQIWTNCADIEIAGSSPGTPTSPPPSIPTSPPPSIPTSPPAPSPTSSPPGQCVAEFQQCGGQDWTGSTNCCNGMRCMQSNQWWSGCFP